jgi:hypothetical protein
MDIRGVYRFSSLMNQNKKAKNYAVFCFAGFFFLCYEVIVKQKIYKRSTIHYSCAIQNFNAWVGLGNLAAFPIISLSLSLRLSLSPRSLMTPRPNLSDSQESQRDAEPVTGRRPSTVPNKLYVFVPFQINSMSLYPPGLPRNHYSCPTPTCLTGDVGSGAAPVSTEYLRDFPVIIE